MTAPETISHQMLETLRQQESDRFLAGLFAPVESRAHLFALLAFDNELARIPHLVSEPMLGAIRYQWWRETLEALESGEARPHDLVPALDAAMKAGGLTAADLIALIDAHETLLEPIPFQSLGDMERHAAGTAGTFMRLGAKLLGADADHPAIAPAGTAYGLIQSLRALPMQMARQTLMLPEEVLASSGARAADVQAGNVTSALTQALGIVAGQAKEHLTAARQTGKPLPRNLAPLLLPASLVPLYAKKISRPGFDIFRERMEVPAFRRQLTLMGRAMRKRL